MYMDVSEGNAPFVLLSALSGLVANVSFSNLSLAME